MDIEELGGAAVQANTLALVELALAIVGGDALLLADLVQTEWPMGRALAQVEVRGVYIGRERTGRERKREQNVPVLHVEHNLHLVLHGGDLLGRRGLGAAES